MDAGSIRNTRAIPIVSASTTCRASQDTKAEIVAASSLQLGHPKQHSRRIPFELTSDVFLGIFELFLMLRADTTSTGSIWLAVGSEPSYASCGI